MSDSAGLSNGSSFQRPDDARPWRLCNINRLIETMKERQLDGIVALLRPNVYYLSNFMTTGYPASHEANGGASLTISRHDPEHPILVVSEADFAVFLDRPTWVEDIRPCASIQLPFGVAVEPSALSRFVPDSVWATSWGQRARGRYEQDLVVATRNAMRDVALVKGRVGFDSLRFGNALAVDGVEVVDAYGTLHYVRSVKTPEEVQIMRTATQINQAAMEEAVRSWQPGMSYREFNREYARAVVGQGGFVYDPGGGLNVANPPDAAFHNSSGIEDFVIEPGMNLMLDCHGTWSQYCWDGGKTWVVDGEPSRDFAPLAQAASDAVREIESSMRPGDKISQLESRGRRVFERSGVCEQDELLIYFHALGLDHVDQELPFGRPDWAVEQGMVISTHLAVRGDRKHRLFLEDVGLITPDGVDPFFTWGHQPLTGRGQDVAVGARA
jgi:Xaa-Pro aminopeptidase